MPGGSAACVDVQGVSGAPSDCVLGEADGRADTLNLLQVDRVGVVMIIAKREDDTIATVLLSEAARVVLTDEDWTPVSVAEFITDELSALVLLFGATTLVFDSKELVLTASDEMTEPFPSGVVDGNNSEARLVPFIEMRYGADKLHDISRPSIAAD
jgi:hypothetical protein